MHLIPHESRPPALLYPLVPAAVRFPVWKTIKLGTHKTIIELAWAIKAADCWVIDSALDLMARPTFTLAAEETEVDLVAVSVGELGFVSGAPVERVYERAQELGLRLCLPEVGPQLLRQHPEKLDDLLLRITMNPIVDSRGRPSTFLLTNDRGETHWWLLWCPAIPGSVWPPTCRLVFVLPRQYGLGRRALTALRHLRLGGLRH